MPYKLPIIATTADGYRFLFGRFTAWFQLALLPLVIWVAIEMIVSNGWLAGGNLARTSNSPLAAHWILNAPFFLAYVLVTVALLLYAVALHRLVLDLPGSTGAFAWLTWRARHMRYLGQAVIVAAILLIGIMVSGTFVPMVGAVAGTAGVLDTAAGEVTLTIIVLLLFAVPIALLTCMVLPALPAAAVEDHAVTLSEASNQAKGNLWRMTLILLVGSLVPLRLVEWGMTFLLARSAADTEPVHAAEVTGILVNFLAFTVVITLLSLIYRRLRDNKTLRVDQPAR
ncbi:MAG: hypothetical protein CMM26_05765 [Rhodospirillaceae bacterium]|nr:hypothetical protein [Rhodospirillaceae bacterium]